MTAIEVENLSKLYRLGAVGGGTLREDVAHWWAMLRKKSNLLLGEKQHGGQDSKILWALRDVSFSVEGGAILGVVGRNGAGKSTLLKILSRITAPTTGEVRLRGRIGSLLEVGTGFHPELSGRDNVFLNGAILGMSRAEITRKFDEILEFSGVERFIDTPVKRYSSGMTVRLAFAVAAHLDPEILIIDEVLAVGDAEFQAKCLGKMSDFAQSGRTVLFVSHNMGAVSSLCTSVIHLEHGVIRATGPAAKIVEAYLRETVPDSSSTIDNARVHGTGRSGLQITGAAVVSRGGASLFFGQRLEWTVTLASQVDLDGLTLGVSVFTRMGICVTTAFVDMEFSVRSSDQLSFTVSIADITLAPGSYNSGFSIGRGAGGQREELDVVIGVASFEVLPIHSGATAASVDWHAAWGRVVPQDVRMTIQSIAACAS